jgi:hypothetical protein
MTRLVRLVAATFVVAAAGLAAPAPSAYAAACSGDSGVTVVVDFNGLGGGVQQVCIAGGAGDAASSLFPAAGFPLSYASRQPGFVCRVKGVPASDPCVNTSPADAFWGLWWSDGDASSWSYSSLGAGSLKIPDGGMVAFSWDDVSGTAPPSASPSHPNPPAPPPTQSSQPPPQPSDDPGQSEQPGQGSSSGPDGSTTGPTSSPSKSQDVEHGKGSMDQERHPKKGKHQKSSPGAAPTESETTPSDTATSADGSVAEPASDSDGLPGWVAPVLIAGLFAAAGAVLLIRQRRSGT